MEQRDKLRRKLVAQIIIMHVVWDEANSGVYKLKLVGGWKTRLVDYYSVCSNKRSQTRRWDETRQMKEEGIEGGEEEVKSSRVKSSQL